MNVGIIYAVTSFVCMLQIILVINRTKATEFKETIDSSFCRMLYFFAVFCLFDILWGLFFSRAFIISQSAFTLISYGYHSGAALSAFIWYGYAMSYVQAKRREKLFLNILRYSLLVMQILALGSNLRTHQAFLVDELGNYSMGPLRLYLYSLQFSYYYILIIYGIYKLLQQRGTNKRYQDVLIFSFIPLAFGFGQYVFYDMSMYALGNMLSAFVIYSYNVTAQREEYLKLKADKLSIDAYMDALTGTYNRRAYEEDLQIYQSVPMKNDFVYVSFDVNGLKRVNDSLGHDAGDEMIKGAVECMQQCFGAYGKLYRTGGDEFVAMIFVSETKMDELTANFEKNVEKWSGILVKNMSVSYGIVSRVECPQMTLLEMAKLADKRMYKHKANYYERIGIDRRANVRE